jgi:threonine/homoserine efflux transporter RhtA
VVLGSALAVYLWHTSPQADPFTIAAMLGAVAQVSLFVARGRLGWANRRLAIATLIMLTFWAAVTLMAGRVYDSAHILLN